MRTPTKQQTRPTTRHGRMTTPAARQAGAKHPRSCKGRRDSQSAQWRRGGGAADERMNGNEGEGAQERSSEREAFTGGTGTYAHPLIRDTRAGSPPQPRRRGMGDSLGEVPWTGGGRREGQTLEGRDKGGGRIPRGATGMLVTGHESVVRHLLVRQKWEAHAEAMMVSDRRYCRRQTNVISSWPIGRWSTRARLARRSAQWRCSPRAETFFSPFWPQRNTETSWTRQLHGAPDHGQ